MVQLKPIETVYQGYRFRSRLEARWAVFLSNTFMMPWQYEVEGFDLGGDVGWYLPDFWLPEAKAYIEIKATTPTREEQRKVAWLQAASGMPVYVIVGSPWTGEYNIHTYSRVNWREFHGDDVYEEIASDPENVIEEEQAVEWLSGAKRRFADCCDCGRLCWVIDEPWSLVFEHIGSPPRWCRPSSEYPPRSDLHVNYALEKARSARFEHGERGR